MGYLAEPIDPIRPPNLIEVRRVFAEPIGAPETIGRHTGKLVSRCASHSRRKDWERGASICCFVASTTGSKRSALERQCRYATQSV